jgi:fatty-acyl-CoA synthase
LSVLNRIPVAVPERLRFAVRTAETVALGAKVLKQTGMLRALRPQGLAALARSYAAGGRPPSPEQIVRMHVQNTPHKTALVDRYERWSYAELGARVNRLAHALARLGVGPGVSVAVLLKNCHQHIELQFALQQLHAIVVQVGYRLKAPEVRYILENSQARAFFYGAEFAEVAQAAAEGAQLSATALIAVGQGKDGADYEALLERVGPQEAPPKVDRGRHPGLMIYTSGTTGKPKGALRDLRRTGLAPFLSFVSKIPLSADDRHLVVCPFYHSSAQAFLGLTFFVGGTAVIMDHFEPEALLRTVEFERVTSMMLVPTMFARLCALPPETLRRYDTRSLRWLISGAAPLPTALAARIEAAFGPILYNFYGATETGFVTIALPGEHTARPGTIGRLLDGVEIRLLDDQGHEVREGEVGELWVKSSMLVAGYHKNQEATAESRRGGFFTVGDLARRDADGYYYLADRKIDMVISGGVNIYPLEIEERLHTHPAVVDCAVVGVPDPDWGESLCAFVVLRPGQDVSADALRAHVTAALADYKKPRHVLFLDALPRNPTGKVLKGELRARAAAALGGDTQAG